MNNLNLRLQKAENERDDLHKKCDELADSYYAAKIDFEKENQNNRREIDELKLIKTQFTENSQNLSKLKVFFTKIF